MKKKVEPQMIAIAAFVVVGLIVCAVGYFAVVSPERAKAAKLVSDIETAQTQATVAAGANARPVPFRASDLFQLAKAMPSADDMPGILLGLRNIADASSVHITSVRPSPRVPLSFGYAALPISVTVSGKYDAISRFLARLRKDVRFSADNRLLVGGRLFDTDSIQLAAAGGTKTSAAGKSSPSDTLSATLALDAFVYGGPAPVSATAGQSTASTSSSGSGR